MKILKILLISIGSLLLSFVIVYLYLDSDVEKSRWICSRIGEDLKISLNNRPKIIQWEGYGWAEEGGEKILLLLSEQDCLIVKKEMAREEGSGEKSDYFDMFKNNGFFPKSVKTWYYRNSQGDFNEYALDSLSRVLYCRYHFE